MIDLEKILNDYENKHYHLQNPHQVKSGKEATVFVVSFQGKPLALKVYIDPEVRAFKNNQTYLEGKYFRSPSERKAVLKQNKVGKRMLHKSWIRREFFLLQKLHQMGANVPKVYEWSSESILMDFIGDEYVAPRLIDTELTPEQARESFEAVLKDVELMLECGIVHSDLSAYNILWWKDKPWIIDLPQAVDIRQNPNKEDLLKRDLNNIINYFNKYLEINANNVYKRFDLIS